MCSLPRLQQCSFPRGQALGLFQEEPFITWGKVELGPSSLENKTKREHKTKQEHKTNYGLPSASRWPISGQSCEEGTFRPWVLCLVQGKRQKLTPILGLSDALQGCSSVSWSCDFLLLYLLIRWKMPWLRDTFNEVPCRETASTGYVCVPLPCLPLTLTLKGQLKPLFLKQLFS